MKICLVGPTYPNKGGIPLHTALLYNSLKRKYNVKLISFKRYYPPFMYPGKVEKDSSKKILKFKADRLLDVINPFSAYKAFLKIKECDVLLLEWAVYQHAVVYFPLLYLVKKFSNVKIVTICHNVLPHKKSFFDSSITKMCLKYSDSFIVHSKKDVKDLKEMFKDANVKLSFNPSFVDALQTKKYSKKEARNKLGIKHDKVILFFGLVREYKGLIYLIRAMPKILEKENVLLLVAGEFWGDKEKEEISKLGKNVMVVDKYIPNEDVGLYFSAADLLVQPYITATQTAIAQIGFSFDIPVIVTNVGGLPETVKDGYTGFVVEKCNSDALAKAVVRFYHERLGGKFSLNVKKEKKKFSWDRYVGDLEGVF